VIGTLAVDGWALVFGRNKTMFFTKTHIELHDMYSVGCRGEGMTVLEMALRRDVAHEIKVGTLAVDVWAVVFGTSR